jgi:hypothetical protein
MARAERGHLLVEFIRVASISYPKRFERRPRAWFATAGGTASIVASSGLFRRKSGSVKVLWFG